MPNTPEIHDSAMLSLELLINGSAIGDQFMVVSAKVERAVNQISTATIIMADDQVGSQSFEASESDFFVPGTALELKVGFDLKIHSIFKGIITGHRIRARRNRPSELQIFCSDESIKMTLGRKSKNFEEKTDGDIIKGIIQEYGLKAEVGATAYQHASMIQYASTDWDFVLSRAKANGLILTNIDGTVKVDKPSVSSPPLLTVDKDRDLYEFDLELDAQSQMVDVNCLAWDHKLQSVIEAKSEEPTVNPQGNITGEKLAEVLNVKGFQLQTSGSLEETELKSWADGTLMKARMARIQGFIEFIGSELALPDTLIEIHGLGDRFNGNAYVSGMEHLIEKGQWRTKAFIGLDEKKHVDPAHSITAPPAGGILPGLEGLQVGTVIKVDGDPDGNTRILVDVPLIEPSGAGIWARISNFYATKNAGSFFLPELGDEVVLGFLNNDPRYAVILGTLYSQKKTAPFTPEEKNNMKAFITKSQLKITFLEEDKDIMIETPGGNKISLSDKNKSIELVDSNKNKLVMDRSGILLDSARDIVLKAKGNVKIDASAGISLDAKADVSVEGLNVTNSAKVSFKGQGRASAELSAAGQTTVKGAMVMIN